MFGWGADWEGRSGRGSGRELAHHLLCPIHSCLLAILCIMLVSSYGLDSVVCRVLGGWARLCSGIAMTADEGTGRERAPQRCLPACRTRVERLSVPEEAAPRLDLRVSRGGEVGSSLFLDDPSISYPFLARLMLVHKDRL
jgi:hypothetical protein